MTTSQSTTTSPASSPSPLDQLASQGVSVWLDDLSRELTDSGELARLVTLGVSGVTSNPTIFAAAVANGKRYEEQLSQLAQRGASTEEAVFAITTEDVRRACDVLRPVFEDTDGVDGRVSLEVDPRQARDAQATIASADALWSAVERQNLFIKIPATVEGLTAITSVIAKGISVNVTLIFSLQRYRAVIEAYLTGLEQAREQGLDLSTIESVASFFVSRVDTEIDTRLAAGTAGATDTDALRSQAGIANARLAYEVYEEVFSSERWQVLAAAGAKAQRALWASTGVKDPSLPDTRYVTELIAPHTVNTMPGKTLAATLDHAVIQGETIRGGYEQAHAVLDQLRAAGIDYDDVVQVLEQEGLAKFEASWQELLQTVAGELDRHRTI